MKSRLKKDNVVKAIISSESLTIENRGCNILHDVQDSYFWKVNM